MSIHEYELGNKTDLKLILRTPQGVSLPSLPAYQAADNTKKLLTTYLPHHLQVKVERIGTTGEYIAPLLPYGLLLKPAGNAFYYHGEILFIQMHSGTLQPFYNKENNLVVWLLKFVPGRYVNAPAYWATMYNVPSKSFSPLGTYTLRYSYSGNYNLSAENALSWIAFLNGIKNNTETHNGSFIDPALTDIIDLKDITNTSNCKITVSEYNDPIGPIPEDEWPTYIGSGMGLRNDGTPKGKGFLGLIYNGSGGYATEISVRMWVGPNDKDFVEIPSIIPILSHEDIVGLITDFDNVYEGKLEIPIKEFAKSRIKQGLSPFAMEGEIYDYPLH